MKKIIFLLCSYFFYVTADEVIFVSLGSICEPSHMLKYCELRKEAYPFDWIVSFDGEALIEMLQEDFRHFFEDEYFVPYGVACLHTYYRLEFLHDGNFENSYPLAELKEKYSRRIERFRSLKNFSGKVIFLRSSYPYSTTDPHRFYLLESNLRISEEYAIRLHDTLKEYFPHLNYQLIILNRVNSSQFEEYTLGPTLTLVNLPEFKELDEKINFYKNFFQNLLNN